MAASIVVAFVLLHTGRTPRVGGGRAAGGGDAGGFVLSRTTGLPSSSDDIGNWTEPLGMASMFVEGAVIALAAYALALARREHRPGIHESVPPAAVRA